MTDKYTEKQLKNYETAPCEAAKDTALYRIGTHLEVIECDGNDTNLTPEQRQIVLDAVEEAKKNG
jgi:hypothetical protein